MYLKRGANRLMTSGRHACGLLFLLAAGLSACGPVSVEQAEKSCLRTAELASRPRGEVAIGAIGGGGGGTRAVGRFEVEVSSDYIMGRDPSAVFDSCVSRKSGQLPTRSLADQPGWRG